MTIFRYVLVNVFGTEGDYEYESYKEAVEAAELPSHYGLMAVVERRYEFYGSALAWQPDGWEQSKKNVRRATDAS